MKNKRTLWNVKNRMAFPSHARSRVSWGFQALLVGLALLLGCEAAFADQFYFTRVRSLADSDEGATGLFLWDDVTGAQSQIGGNGAVYLRHAADGPMTVGGIAANSTGTLYGFALNDTATPNFLPLGSSNGAWSCPTTLQSRLVTIDTNTAEITYAGPYQSGRALLAAAFDGTGRLWAYDCVTKEVVEIDPATGGVIGTPIATGITATVASGMDFAANGLGIIGYNELQFRVFDPDAGWVANVPISASNNGFDGGLPNPYAIVGVAFTNHLAARNGSLAAQDCRLNLQEHRGQDELGHANDPFFANPVIAFKEADEFNPLGGSLGWFNGGPGDIARANGPALPECFYDWGDAPNSYGTLLGSSGAQHSIVAGGPFLGAGLPDFEVDGQPVADATGDNLGGTDDEDGVTVPELVRGATIDIEVEAGDVGPDTRLQGWIDWAGDGSFGSGDQVFADATVVDGVNTLSVTVPANAGLGTSFARFRIANESGLGATGAAGSGEVEDYQVTLADLEVDIELTGGPCWRMLSSPVDGLTYADMLDGLWTQGASGSDYPGGNPHIFLWPDGQTGNDPSGWQPLGDLNQVIPPGTGFLISVYADDDYDGVDDPFPKTLSVSGPAHGGDITPPMNTNPGGWTLVGNPYGQPVDFNSLTTTDLTGVGYVWDRNTGNWASTTSDGFGDVTDGAFAPGQGFFVQNTGSPTSPSITFTEGSRTTGGEFYGKQNEPNKPTDYLRLEVQGESLYNSMWVRFSGNGSVEPAYGDALELQPLSEQYALLGARKTDGTLVDIGHFPLPDEALQIPVHVDATRPGSYTITATDLDIPAATELYLHDLETGETVAITDSFEYTFTISEAAAKSTPDQGITACSATPVKAKTTGADRFMIITSAGTPESEVPEQVALGQNYPNPFNPATQITYQLPAASEVHLEVFDMLGRRVATLVEGTVQAGVHQVTFDAAHLTSGVYLYRLTASGPQGGQQIFTKKLTLIK